VKQEKSVYSRLRRLLFFNFYNDLNGRESLRDDAKYRFDYLEAPGGLLEPKSPIFLPQDKLRITAECTEEQTYLSVKFVRPN